MRNKFEIGDLVSHTIRPYTGVIIEIIFQEHLSYKRAPMYKVTWEYGEWMYEVEEQLKIEARAKCI
jgi:heat shock protein HspQ